MAEQLNEVTVTNYQNNSPFYYDKILINYITTVSLHPNTILKSELDDEENYEWSTVEKADPTNVDDDGYSYKAIVRAPYLDDYILNSQNNWSEFGEDEIGKAWNSLKPWEPYLKRASEEIGSMIDTTREKRSDQGSDVSRSFIGGFLRYFIFSSIVLLFLSNLPITLLLNLNSISSQLVQTYTGNTTPRFLSPLVQ